MNSWELNLKNCSDFVLVERSWQFSHSLQFSQFDHSCIWWTLEELQLHTLQLRRLLIGCCWMSITYLAVSKLHKVSDGCHRITGASRGHMTGKNIDVEVCGNRWEGRAELFSNQIINKWSTCTVMLVTYCADVAADRSRPPRGSPPVEPRSGSWICALGSLICSHKFTRQCLFSSFPLK